MKSLYKKNYIIADFGASNGRISVASYSEDSFEIETVHRFENSQILLNGSYYWDILHLFSELKKGIFISFQKYKNIRSVAVDTWGLDFSLINRAGKLMSNPLTYRDPVKSQRNPKKFFKTITEIDFFKLTGCFPMSYAPAFFLEKLASEDNYELKNAYRILPLSDLFNYFLTGNYAIEYSMASGMLLVNCKTKKWEDKIIKEAGISKNLLSRIIDSGEVVGDVSKEIVAELDIKPFSVSTVAGHDTASAVAGIPSISDDYDVAFLSTGTWLVLGAETKKPILDFESTRHFFMNEGGSSRRNFFARNITGFWIIQKCVERWGKEEGRQISWKEIDSLFIKEKSFKSIINTQDPVFSQNSDNMPELIRSYCQINNIDIPESKGHIARCIYESLVMNIRFYFELLKKYCNKEFKKVHIVGGGVNNNYFCQWLADALEVEIVAGPTESSTVGNLLMQLKADKEIVNLTEGRKLSINSFTTKTYEPKDALIWDEKYREFVNCFNLP
jgi:rhamnulokinase